MNQRILRHTSKTSQSVCAWVLIKLFAMGAGGAVRVAGWAVLFYASSNSMFGSAAQTPQSEQRQNMYAQVVLSYACSAHSKGLFLFARFCMNFISHNYSLTHGRAFAYFRVCQALSKADSGGRETAAHIEAVHLYI